MSYGTEGRRRLPGRDTVLRWMRLLGDCYKDLGFGERGDEEEGARLARRGPEPEGEQWPQVGGGARRGHCFQVPAAVLPSGRGLAEPRQRRGGRGGVAPPAPLQPSSAHTEVSDCSLMTNLCDLGSTNSSESLKNGIFLVLTTRLKSWRFSTKTTPSFRPFVTGSSLTSVHCLASQRSLWYWMVGPALRYRSRNACRKERTCERLLFFYIF